jgi:hypothetical protein
MAKYHITETNAATERLLGVTENPRHRFLLQSHYRHRYLTIAGRYQEIFAPEMMVEHPVYHVHAVGINTTLDGREAVESVYRDWSENGRCVFYAENEQVAVADNFIASVGIIYQQTSGKLLRAAGVDVDDENAMYLYKLHEQMISPYDEQGRMIGQDVWEVDPAEAEIIKLAPADVLSVHGAAALLNPLIKPLPPYDEVVQPARPVGQL